VSQFPPPLPLQPPALPPPLPYIPRSVRRKLGNLRQALVGLGVCFSMLLGLLILLGFGHEFGTRDLKITMLMAFVPVPIYVLLVLWLDRMEKEPWYLLVIAFLYGATFAIFFASIPNDLTSKISGESAALVFSAPICEEFFKGLFILGLFWLRQDEFDGVLDGVVYAAMVGLGFAAMENLQYYGKVVHEGTKHIQEVSAALRGTAVTESQMATVMIFLIRGVFGPFAHPLFTSMTGVGLGLSQQFCKGAMRVIAPVLGYFAAVLLHATWNGTAGIGGFPVFVVAYFIIFLPTFIGLAMLARYSIRKEGELVSAQLLNDVNLGFLSPADYRALVSPGARKADLAQARAIGGRSLASARKAFHQAATELAFYRFRVARGIKQPDPQIEADHFRNLSEIHRRVEGLTPRFAPVAPSSF
jgi:protease PrsW